MLLELSACPRCSQDSSQIAPHDAASFGWENIRLGIGDFIVNTVDRRCKGWRMANRDVQAVHRARE